MASNYMSRSKTMLFLPLAFSAIVLFVLWPNEVKGQQANDGVQFVSVNGNDTSNGLTWNTAKATIQAAINVLPALGGRVYVGQGDYTLTSGISTNLPNLEIDCLGGPGTEISRGSVRIHVPSGAVGFTFNPSGTQTLFNGPTIKGCSFMASTGATGGIHIVRSNNFTIERVSADGFSGAGSYALYLDGTGNIDQYGVVLNSTFTNSNIGIKMNLVSGIRLIGNHLDGAQNGGVQVTPGTIGIYQTGGQSGTTMASNNVIQGYDTLVQMDHCENDMLASNRFENFITAAIDLDAAGGSCRGVQIFGGSISNFVGGSQGTGIVVGSSVTKTLIIISDIESVQATISNSGTGSYIVNN